MHYFFCFVVLVGGVAWLIQNFWVWLLAAVIFLVLAGPAMILLDKYLTYRREHPWI